MNTPNEQSGDPAALLRAALPDDAPEAPWPAPTPAELAAAFPELTVHELVGQGGMAAVYRATQSRLDRPVALKVMRRDLAAQPRFAERFLREAKALAALSNPHVLLIHDFGERAGFYYLLTEFVDGANLRELMRMGRLSPAEVLRIVPQICAGLWFAHQHGVVHRDIKPENVLVDRDGHVKLADFGLAKLAGEPGSATFTRSGQVFGTPHYMAPEQWQGSADVDHRADIYSLGVVLYELLTGRLPVGTYAPASRQPGVPSGVDQVVQRTLQQEPARRYQSAREVQRELERQGTVAMAPARNGPRAAWLLAAALLVFVIGTASVCWFEWRESARVAMKESFREDDARNGRLMADLVATVKDGKAWIGEVPTQLSPMHIGTLAEGVRTTIAIGGGLAVFVATMLLAGAAWRRTRFAGSSRGEHVLAGLMLAMPMVTAIACGLAWYPAVKTDGEPFFAPWLVIVLTAVGIAVVFAVSWPRSAHRPVGIPGPMSWWTRGGLGLCTVVALYCMLLLMQAPRRELLRPQIAMPLAGEQLVGLSRRDVLDRLGPPVSIMATNGAMAWNYWRITGDGQDALQLTNGVVAGFLHAPGSRPDVPLVGDWPAGSAFLGQTVQELVAKLGPATSTTNSSSVTELSFADGTTATIGPEGIVVGLRK